jgi:hypothetical protein
LCTSKVIKNQKRRKKVGYVVSKPAYFIQVKIISEISMNSGSSTLSNCRPKHAEKIKIKEYNSKYLRGSIPPSFSAEQLMNHEIRPEDCLCIESALEPVLILLLLTNKNFYSISIIMPFLYYILYLLILLSSGQNQAEKSLYPLC